MLNDQYISVREAAQLLGVSEKKIMDLIEEKKLVAYRIANQFLRLKKTDVTQLSNSGSVAPEMTVQPYTFGERVQDFFYYNDFYIFSGLIILFLLFIIIYD